MVRSDVVIFLANFRKHQINRRPLLIGGAVVVLAVALSAFLALQPGGLLNEPAPIRAGVQRPSSGTFLAGRLPVLTFAVSNDGPAVNIATVSLSGPGITSVHQGPGITGSYTWIPDAAWQAANPIVNGVTKITLDVSTSPTFAPGTLTTQGTSYTAVVNFTNGRSIEFELRAQ